MNTCVNCDNTFTGDYCNLCGEKIVSSIDFSLSSMMGQAIGAVTNFDSKIFRSLKLLLFYPGSLSVDNVQGIRVKYMKPFQLFLIANIIFFLFLSDLDLFRTPSIWFFQEDFDGIKVLQEVRAIIAETGMTQSEIAIEYDKKSSDLAKGLIIFIIPFIALIGKLLHLKKDLEFGKHIIFATHFFAFVLILCVLNNAVIPLFFSDFNKWFFIIPITTFMLIHYIVGIKRFYNNSWIAAILKGVMGVFLINVVIQFYRIGINLISLNSI